MMVQLLSAVSVESGGGWFLGRREATQNGIFIVGMVMITAISGALKT